jgi:hypothetical protein
VEFGKADFEQDSIALIHFTSIVAFYSPSAYDFGDYITGGH